MSGWNGFGKSEIELDKESVEQVRKLFDDYVVDPLGTKLLDSEKGSKGMKQNG